MCSRPTCRRHSLATPAACTPEEVILSYPGVQAITSHRIAHELYRLGVPMLPRMMSEVTHSRTGIDIHPGATIGHSFFIDHGTGLVMGETTLIGSGAKLYQGVTLGALSVRGGRDEAGSIKRHPTLEDDVTIYAGATILGGETVIGARQRDRRQCLAYPQRRSRHHRGARQAEPALQTELKRPKATELRPRVLPR